MSGARVIIGLLGLFVAACSARAEPPAELSGLWSAGPAACAAGVGIRFTPEAIEAIYEDHSETLFEHPRYHIENAGENFRVRIEYALPRTAGAGRTAGAHGVIVLSRDGRGLAPDAHNLVDGITGAARMRLADDPVLSALSLQPCGRHPWREDLRGLSAT